MRHGMVMGLALATGLAATGGAQERGDSLGFRKGQWAADFAAGTEARSLGVARFISPREALVFDGGLSLHNSKVGRAETSSRAGLFRLGLRWYRPVAPRLQQVVTVGGLGGVTRNREQQAAVDPSPAQDRRSRGTQWGGFANLGALWMTAPHFGVGATWEAKYLHFSERAEGGTGALGTITARSNSFSAGSAMLVVTLAF